MIHVQQIVNKVFTSNTFVISFDNSSDYWLVDVGDFEEVLRILPDNAVIKGVFLTHTHFDHIYGINHLHQRFPDVVVYTSIYGKEALFSAKKNFSFYHEEPIEYEGNYIRILKEGDEVEIYPSERMKIYETPGHCPSCLTYQLENKLFTGDSYIPGIKVVSRLPKGDKNMAQASELKIKELSKDKNIYPGHGVNE